MKVRYNRSWRKKCVSLHFLRKHSLEVACKQIYLFQEFSDCDAFTYHQDTEGCFVWDFCGSFSPDTCPYCISGDASCDAYVNFDFLLRSTQLFDIFQPGLLPTWHLQRPPRRLRNHPGRDRLQGPLPEHGRLLVVLIRLQRQRLPLDVRLPKRGGLQQRRLCARSSGV